MRNKISIGQRVQVEIWHEAANHWDWDWPETLVGTIVSMPIPTYQNNWNYNPREFDLRTDKGDIVHIKNARKITPLALSSSG